MLDVVSHDEYKKLLDRFNAAMSLLNAEREYHSATLDVLGRTIAEANEYRGRTARETIRADLAEQEARLVKTAVNTFFFRSIHDSKLLLTHTKCGHPGIVGVNCFHGDDEVEAIRNWYLAYIQNGDK